MPGIAVGLAPTPSRRQRDRRRARRRRGRGRRVAPTATAPAPASRASRRPSDRRPIRAGVDPIAPGRLVETTRREVPPVGHVPDEPGQGQVVDRLDRRRWDRRGRTESGRADPVGSAGWVIGSPRAARSAAVRRRGRRSGRESAVIDAVGGRAVSVVGRGGCGLGASAREPLAERGVGPRQDRADVAGAGPQEPGDLGVVVAVVVAKDDRRPRLGLQRRPAPRRRPPPDDVDGGSPPDRGPPPSSSATRPRTGTASWRTRRRRRASRAVFVTMPWSQARSGPVRVVLLPALERPGERVVGRVDGAVRIPEDPVGHPVDVVGVVAVGPVHGVAAELLVDHVSCTRRVARSLQRSAGASLRGGLGSRGTPAGSSEQAPLADHELHPGPLAADGGRRAVTRAGPGRRPRGRPAGRSTRPSPPGRRPGRSTRPQPPVNRVSPLRGSPGRARRDRPSPPCDPGCGAPRTGPRRSGPCRPRPARRPARTAGSGTGAHRGCGSTRRWRSSGWTAIGAPVCSATAALSPMWSQWPWVETMSLSVQVRWPPALRRSSRATGSRCRSAIASRERSSTTMRTFVATGPMTGATCIGPSRPWRQCRGPDDEPTGLPCPAAFGYARALDAVRVSSRVGSRACVVPAARPRTTPAGSSAHECGTGLSSACPTCGATNRPGPSSAATAAAGSSRARRSAPMGPAATAGRRSRPPSVGPSSVLFVDLVGFTTLDRGPRPRGSPRRSRTATSRRRGRSSSATAARSRSSSATR